MKRYTSIELSKESFVRARLYNPSPDAWFLVTCDPLGRLDWYWPLTLKEISKTWLYFLELVVYYCILLLGRTFVLNCPIICGTFPNSGFPNTRSPNHGEVLLAWQFPHPPFLSPLTFMFHIKQVGTPQINDSRLEVSCLVQGACIRAKLCLIFLGWRNYTDAYMGQAVMGSITSKQNRWAERSELGTQHGAAKSK